MERDVGEALRRTFVDEGADQVEAFFQALVRLSEDPQAAADLEAGLRNLHNLKGSAAGLGLSVAAAFAHEVEGALARRRGRLPVPAAELDQLLDAADALGVHLEELRLGAAGEEPRGEGWRRMEAWREARGGPPGRSAELEALARTRPGARLVWVHFLPEAPLRGLRARLVLRNLARRGEVLASDPGEEALDLLDGSTRPLVVVLVPGGEGDPRPALEAAADFPEVLAVEIQDPAPAATPELPGRGDDLVAEDRVRVPISRIDGLLQLAGELGACRRDLVAFAARALAEVELPRRDRHLLEELLDRQAVLLERLTEDVLATRMVPIARLFARFPRLVRDLCRRLGKQARLVVEGGGTELDTKLVDRVGDPLVHLLRNALDHGIEPPEVRTRAGKPAEGTVRLRALAEGQSICVEVEDDGVGLDFDAIRGRAVAQGVLTPAAAARSDPAELIELLFRPGFTTRHQVSEVSGRGVGLDVVRREVEDLNGELSVEPRLDGGVRFSLRFPLTLAMTEALLVRSRGQVFALPLGHVEEVVRRDEVEAARLPGTGPALLLRDRTLPTVGLGELLEGPPEEGPGARFLVVVRAGTRGLALGVEELLGEASLVVQSLTPHFRGVEGVAGAAVGNDGRIVLILDVPAAVRRRRERHG